MLLFYGFYYWSCGSSAISLKYTVSLVQWVNRSFPIQGVSGSCPGDAPTHNQTGFLLLAMSRCIGDPNVIDHWLCPRLCANNGKLNQASQRRCDKPTVITCCMSSSSSSQHSDQLEPWSSCLGGGGSPMEALQFHSITQPHWSNRSTVCFPSMGSTVRIPGMHPLSQ